MELGGHRGYGFRRVPESNNLNFVVVVVRLF